MRTNAASIYVLAGVFLLTAATTSGDAATLPVLQIQADKMVARVSPVRAGLMTEEINHSFDGGLYAELVRDRAMTGGLQPRAGALGAWTLIDGASRAGLALDVMDPLSEACREALE